MELKKLSKYMSKKISKNVKKKEEKKKADDQDLNKSNLSNVLSFYDDLSISKNEENDNLYRQ